MLFSRIRALVLLGILSGFSLAAAAQCLVTDEKVRTAYVTAKAGLRVRSEPDLRGKVLAVLPVGSEVLRFETRETRFSETRIAGVSGRWVRIQYSGNEGWAFDAYLDDRNPVETASLKRQSCKPSQARVALGGQDDIAVSGSDSASIPCLIDVEAEFPVCDDVPRRAIVDAGGRWLLLETGTDVGGHVCIIDLRKMILAGTFSYFKCLSTGKAPYGPEELCSWDAAEGLLYKQKQGRPGRCPFQVFEKNIFRNGAIAATGEFEEIERCDI